MDRLNYTLFRMMTSKRKASKAWRPVKKTLEIILAISVIKTNLNSLGIVVKGIINKFNSCLPA